MNLRKKLMNKGLLFIFLCFIAGSISFSQDADSDIKKAFTTGDARLLLSHLSEQVTLSITGKETEVIKSQAVVKINDFFVDHKVKNFSIKFEGGKSSSKFMIGTLYTEQGTFRINIFFTKDGEKEQIQNIRIEKDNESEF